MQDMLRRIVDMDRKAREITDAAQAEKIEAEAEINRRAAALREDYLEQARRRIRINAETDRTIFEQRWKRRATAYAEQEAKLDALYAEKQGEWVDAIVTRVLAES